MEESAKFFDELVARALDRLPLAFRRKLSNVEVIVKDRPGTEAGERFDPSRASRLLGLYRGVPLNKRSVFYSSALPDRIILYRGNILSVCRTAEDVEDAVFEVLKHEVGHHFGLTEEDLR